MKNFKFQKISVADLDDRTLLINLYATQALTLLIGAVILLFQKDHIVRAAVSAFDGSKIMLWGGAFALIVLLGDWLMSRWVPDHVSDDGGVNRKIFRRRPLWHIAVICLVVAFCEEILFRGAIQHWLGPYWTSILFAAIHIRYLQHWIMTGMVFGVSYGLGWIYIQTGSLLTPIVAHFIIDFAMGCIIRYRREL